MHLIQMPRFIEICYEARRVPFVWGPKGVGKSDGVRQAVEALGNKMNVPFGLVDLRLGCMEVGDLIGIPRTREVSKGLWRTVYAVPDWFPIPGQLDANGVLVPEHGLVFLDEFNRAGTNDVIQAMFQFILGEKVIYTDDKGKVCKRIDRYLHTHKLPKGWSVACAGNPDTSDYVVQALDTSMLDRLIQVVVDVEKKVSVHWMQNNLENDEIWKFVKATREALGKPEDCRINVQPSSRSYEFVDDMLKCMSEDDFDNFGLEVLIGIVGETVGTLLYKHLKSTLLKPLTAKEVMNCKDFDKFIKEKITQYISKAKNHLELIDVTLDDILKEVKEKEPTEAQSLNITLFTELIPADMALKFMQEGAAMENFINVILTLMNQERNAFTLEMIKAMGYEEGVIKENLEKLDKIVKEYEEQMSTTKAAKKTTTTKKKAK